MSKRINHIPSRAHARQLLSLPVILGFVLLGAFLFLAGCVQPPVPQDRYYRIEAPAPSNGGLLLPGTVEVDRFGAEGLASGRAIIFIDETNGDTLQEYNYDFWHKPPGDMLRDAIVDYLRNSNAAHNFVTPEMRADADFLLSGRIQKLETVRGASPKAVVALELAVTNLSTNKVRLVRSYRTEVPASSGTVNAAVAAVNQAIGDIFARFLSDLRG